MSFIVPKPELNVSQLEYASNKQPPPRAARGVRQEAQHWLRASRLAQVKTVLCPTFHVKKRIVRQCKPAVDVHAPFCCPYALQSPVSTIPQKSCQMLAVLERPLKDFPGMNIGTKRLDLNAPDKSRLDHGFHPEVTGFPPQSVASNSGYRALDGKQTLNSKTSNRPPSPPISAPSPSSETKNDSSASVFPLNIYFPRFISDSYSSRTPSPTVASVQTTNNMPTREHRSPQSVGHTLAHTSRRPSTTKHVASKTEVQLCQQALDAQHQTLDCIRSMIAVVSSIRQVHWIDIESLLLTLQWVTTLGQPRITELYSRLIQTFYDR